MMNCYVLRNQMCESCVWGENGHYNAICAHCPFCEYGKKAESSWMLRETAEMLGLVERKNEVEK